MNKAPVVLYVDDEPINLMLFENLFEKKYTIITAESGTEGLNLLKNNKFDVVFSDMRMPEMNGLEFIRLAKAQYSNIAFYILSGYEITEEIEKAITNKLIDRYFQKPFIMKEIDNCIQEKCCNK